VPFHGDVYAASSFARDLDSLLKNGDQKVNLQKSDPQGLKAALILLRFRHD
jgi:hypothetical protein